MRNALNFGSSIRLAKLAAFSNAADSSYVGSIYYNTDDQRIMIYENTTEKWQHLVADNSVTSAKILLENNTALRSKKADTSLIDLLKINTSDVVVFGGAQHSLNGIVYTFPSAQASGAQFLRNDGTGSLTWTTVPTPTLQSVYASGNTITTSSGNGNVTIAGTEKLVVSTTGGIDVSISSASNPSLHLKNTLAGGVLSITDTSATNIFTIYAPSAFTTSYSWTLPTTQATSGQYLQNNGSGVLSWSTVATPTLQSVYASGNTITTSSGSGNVIIAGTEKLVVSTTGGIDVQTGKILNSTTNGNIYLTPNGNGYISAQVPDSTTAGGNARGNHSLDLQTLRSAAAQVASATASVALGQNNTASGTSSFAAGESNTASGYGSIAMGTGSSATTQDAIAIGDGCSASAYASLAIGYSSTSSANYAVTLGRRNTASHASAVTLGAGAASQADCDFIMANQPSPSSSSTSYNHFRIAGDTSDVHIGRFINQASVSGATNKLYFHTKNANNQSNAITLSAPATLAATVNFVLPATDGTTGQFLKTDGSGNLGWLTSTLQLGYNNNSPTVIASNLVADVQYNITDNTYRYVQGFSPASNTTISSVTLQLSAYLGGAHGDIAVEIRSVPAYGNGLVGSTLLGTSSLISASTIVSQLPSATTCVFTFATPVAITTSTLYYLVVVPQANYGLNSGGNFYVMAQTGHFTSDKSYYYNGSSWGSFNYFLYFEIDSPLPANIITTSQKGSLWISGTQSLLVTATGGIDSSISSATNPSLHLKNTLAGGVLSITDTSATNIFTIYAPSAFTTSYSWTLPTAQAAAGQYLQNNGSGVLSWSTPTLQSVYASGNTITTNSGVGSVIIAGTEKLQVTATGGLESNSVKLMDVSNYVLDYYKSNLTLTNNTTATLATFGFATASYCGCVIEYAIKEAHTRVGRIFISTNGADASLTDYYSETGDVGVVWSASYASGSVSVSYTTTALTANRSMNACLRFLQNPA